MDRNKNVTVTAEPYEFQFNLSQCALLIIDMQRSFLETGGFGEMLGNDVNQLRRTISPSQKLLEQCRAASLKVIHTREGHRPDLSDLSLSKKIRGRNTMGRILVRGEPGHDIIPELYPRPGEPIIDKCGKNAFYDTDLDGILKNYNVKQLVVTSVTTEVCVSSTVREANDRGYECLVLKDCVGS